jgi:anthranilate synthase component 1
MLIPVWREIPFDLETPVSAFAKLRRGAFAFLLESAPAGSETWSRFTYFGTEPRAAWRLKNGVVHDWAPDGQGWRGERRPTDPLADLEALLTRERAAVDPELARRCGGFWGGAVGFFGYDVVRHIEHLPDAPDDALRAPDALFVFTRVLVVVDNLRSRAILVASVAVRDDAPESERAPLVTEAQRDLDEAVRRIQGPASRVSRA